MLSFQEPLALTNSTTSGSSSSFLSSIPSSMETQPSRPFFFGRCAEKNKKLEFIHEDSAEKSEVSKESSSPPCVFYLSRKKPLSNIDTTDSSPATTRKRKERGFDESADAAAKKKLVNLVTPIESCLENKDSGEEEVVSTELTLFHGFKINNDVSSGSMIHRKFISYNFLVPNLAKFKSCRCGRDEEQRLGVSTELKLYDDPWVIKKVLKGSDVGPQSRLLVDTKSVRAHILPMVGSVRAEQIYTEKGLQVTILDLETGSEHQLVFKKWLKPSSYVLLAGWRKQFVNGKGLKRDDEIGLFWDCYSLRFYFRILARAPKPFRHGNI